MDRAKSAGDPGGSSRAGRTRADRPDRRSRTVHTVRMPLRLVATLAALTAITFPLQLPALAAAQSVTATATVHGATLDAVSCPRTTLCIAVGARKTAHGVAPLAEKWTGHRWVVQSIAVPRSGQADLTGVSCPTSKDCTAIGEAIGSRTRVGLFAEQWNGTKWHISQSGNPRGVKQGNLAAVSCARSSYCVAVGSSQPGKKETALSERWNGSSWKMLKAAAVSGSVVLADVSCTGTFCMAVGQAGRSLLHVTAEQLTGSTWTARTVPAPAGSNFSSLYGVWCSGQSYCLAVGQTQGTFNGAVAYVYNGGWSRQTVSGKNQILFGISCTGPARCMAVGSGLTRPVSQRWHIVTPPSASWTPLPTAHVSGAPFASLADVSCPGRSRCFAVGSRSNGSPTDLGTTLAEEWTGTSWHVQATVNP